MEENFFRGESRDIGSRRVFGGQVLGQALSAASYTVENFTVHSLHAYFLRAGDIGAPILYEVDRARDGRSFSNRRVVAVQHGRPIFNTAAARGLNAADKQHGFLAIERGRTGDTGYWFMQIQNLQPDRLLPGTTRLK